SSVSLVMALGGTMEARTSPLPNVKITPSEHFVADIEEVLGKGAITLVT
ncbi:MAG: polymerase subunit alpha, partial [Nitrospirota bacterium]|nr:polymerase subunit alpha [Nitrospirota bacterium]